MFNRTSKVYRAIGRINRKTFINPINRKKLKNHDFSIISNNCTGSLITHDLGKRFLTPTVNLFLSTRDFIKFIENIDFYLQQKIEEIFKEGINYPIGKLGDIELHFMHFETIIEAKEKWYERSKRINYENLYIIMVDGDGCSDEIIQRFEKLPFKKVFLTNKNYKQYNSSFYIKGFEKKPNITDLSLYKNIFGQKFYDNFDYVKWLNNEM
ncbi:hypothetical protein AN960_00250 [Bacillus sp. FJAT-25509]|uniref:DUF1919 domain-containing protein n=1 Tax=Bacillus sp. FJAT-25509 TaxID=1712029 RepID=UPI0006FD794E|nr:DUF1919 domain-containing protein [Bacillus sp. FJAT-25509]KQL42432.1 hypothetical protein AN960_00250 [Bacillus sp. FJAT-25509]